MRRWERGSHRGVTVVVGLRIAKKTPTRTCVPRSRPGMIARKHREVPVFSQFTLFANKDMFNPWGGTMRRELIVE